MASQIVASMLKQRKSAPKGASGKGNLGPLSLLQGARPIGTRAPANYKTKHYFKHKKI